MRDLTEVARELAEAAIKQFNRWLVSSDSNKIESIEGWCLESFEPILTKHFPPQPVAMEALVERIVCAVFTPETFQPEHVEYLRTRATPIIRAELAPVETLLRDYREHLNDEAEENEEYSESEHATIHQRQETSDAAAAFRRTISQIDTILGGQHGTCE